MAPADDQRGSAAKALPDLALRLITGLAAGDTAAAFRTAVSQLAQSDKQQLQVRAAKAAVWRLTSCELAFQCQFRKHNHTSAAGLHLLLELTNIPTLLSHY